jgi:hypothetical protein
MVRRKSLHSLMVHLHGTGVALIRPRSRRKLLRCGVAALLVLALAAGVFPPFQFSSIARAASMDTAREAGKLISTSYLHSLALKADGTVAAWGHNDKGQCNVPAGLANVVAVSAGYYHSLALKADGTVVGWGGNFYRQCDAPSEIQGQVVAVSAGEYHSLALKADGTVVAWGDNRESQLAVPVGLSDVVAVSAGDSHSLALKADGTVVAWGDNCSNQIDVPVGLSDVVAISAGSNYSLAIKSDGTVVAWGSNTCGESDVPAGIQGQVVAISGGEAHTLALKSDGTVAAWGFNFNAQCNVPPGLANVVAVSAGNTHSLALKEDGTVVAWGYNGWDQCNVPAGLNLLAGQFLSSLQASAFLLAPVFDPQTFSYSVAVPHGVTGVKITALLADPTNETLRINGNTQDNGVPYTVSPLDVGSNSVSVGVASPAGLTRTYTVTIYRYSATSNASPIGDVNGDGVLDVSDAILILRRIVGLIVAFPVEQP